MKSDEEIKALKELNKKLEINNDNINDKNIKNILNIIDDFNNDDEAQQLKDDPTFGSIYLPEYETGSGTRYNYSWSFANEMFNDIDSQLANNHINRHGLAIHDYRQLLEILNK